MKRDCAHPIALAAFAALALAGCQRESRDFEPPTKTVSSPSVRMSMIQPGAVVTGTALEHKYEDNAYALSEGKRLFGWYNCNGCHANGGGDKGPALMDNVWVYGSDPANIYATIVEGRPNGMPSFGSMVPDDQIWELAAYVRSMAGLESSAAAPGRNDDMMSRPSENRLPGAASEGKSP